MHRSFEGRKRILKMSLSGQSTKYDNNASVDTLLSNTLYIIRVSEESQKNEVFPARHSNQGYHSGP